MQLHDEVEPPGPRVLIACDKFKGTLTSAEVAAHLTTGLASVGIRSVQAVPVADGGDGSLDAALAAGARSIEITAEDSQGHPRRTAIALLPDGSAVVEVARICGLGDARPSAEDAVHATSRGVGTALRAALDHGARALVLAVGGTATTDGGAGLIQALGGRLLDRDGRELGHGAAALRALASVDLSGLDPRLTDLPVTVASDVDSPLLGEHGAAAVFGPQKGAGPAEVVLLERLLTRWSELAGPALANSPGSGAGGGIGFGALLLGGTVRSGAGYFLDLVGLDRRLARTDLVVTGEGRLDEQSLRGKAPVAVAARARAAGVPVHAVVGRCDLDPTRQREAGLATVQALTDLNPRCAEDVAVSRRLLEQVGASLGRHALATHDPDRTAPPAL